MNFFKIIPNYIFFTVANRHFKKEGEDAFTGVLAVSFFFFMVEVTFLYILLELLGSSLKELPYSELVPIVLMIGTFLAVKKIYKNKYPKFAKTWKQDSIFYKILGFIYVIICFLFPVIIGVVFKNFMGI